MNQEMSGGGVGQPQSVSALRESLDHSGPLSGGEAVVLARLQLAEGDPAAAAATLAACLDGSAPAGFLMVPAEAWLLDALASDALDRLGPVRLAEYGEDPRVRHLPQARRHRAATGGKARRHTRATRVVTATPRRQGPLDLGLAFVAGSAVEPQARSELVSIQHRPISF
jgi:hypothetical protein